MITKQTNQPTTLQQAILHFSDPDTCLAFMKPLVWANGVTCPHCGVVGEHHFIASRRIWRCTDCKKQFSIKIGTVMEDSPLSLDKWLVAMWLISNAKNGISSYEIHRDLGITQKTAWFLLHRIRLAMKTGSFKKAGGTVEVDETYVGGKVANFKKSKLKALRTREPLTHRQEDDCGGRVGARRGRQEEPSASHGHQIDPHRPPEATGASKRGSWFKPHDRRAAEL